MQEGRKTKVADEPVGRDVAYNTGLSKTAVSPLMCMTRPSGDKLACEWEKLLAEAMDATQSGKREQLALINEATKNFD